MKSISLQMSKPKEGNIQLKSYQHKTVEEMDSLGTNSPAKEQNVGARRVGLGGSGGADALRVNNVHCAMLGDGMVGKTCLTLSYTQHLFTDRYTATVFDNYPVPVSVGGEEFVISVFDTAGQTDYESVRAYTYHSSEVLVLCFSVCERESFYNVLHCWLPEIQRHTKGKRPLLLVGTQIDLRTRALSSFSSVTCSSSSSSCSSSCSSASSSLFTSSSSSCFSSQEEVSTEEGNQLARMIGADCYIECSARSQEGLQQVFQHVVFSALKYRKKKRSIFSKLFTQRHLSNKALRRAVSTLMIPSKVEACS